MSAMEDASDANTDGPGRRPPQVLYWRRPRAALPAPPLLREYVTDAAFCKRLRELRKKCEAATTPEAMGELTRLMLHDPRLTQCSMAGAGMNLTVESEDIKKAERTGDVEKMSPIRVDDVVAAQEMCQDASQAKAEGNARFAAGDSAGALAFWARALRLDRENDGPDDMALAAALYGNIAAALVKLGYWNRAEQAASRAVAYCDVVENVNVRRRALYRRALAREKRRDVARAYSDVLEARGPRPSTLAAMACPRSTLHAVDASNHTGPEARPAARRAKTTEKRYDTPPQAHEARRSRSKSERSTSSAGAEEARAAHQRTAGVGALQQAGIINAGARLDARLPRGAR